METSEIEIKNLENEIKALKLELQQKQQILQQKKQKLQSNQCGYNQNLTTEEIVRYSRQMIMPQIRIDGQLSLKFGKVLIVGAGGLGCPAALYLASAGIGELHIVDYDEVELTNLHRQILHNQNDIQIPKVQSIYEKLNLINSHVKIVPIVAHANSTTLLKLFENKYDVVLDCTDNVPTRYLLNDICVLYNTPLVSGSALQMDGQLTVYHYNNGPCYRCLFPKPPPPHTVTNCGDGGVLGPVCGVIGVLQALETIKILTKCGDVLSERLLIFDATETIFRNIKLRKKQPNCDICGDDPKIKSLIDYEQFCGSKAHDKIIDINVLDDNENISVTSFDWTNRGCVIIDVRPELEYEMCKLPNTINLPYSQIQIGKHLGKIDDLVKNHLRDDFKVYLLCRRGNDSQRALNCLKQYYPGVNFVNIQGGLRAYSQYVDAEFPVY